jgi:hypothetical protein
MHSVLARIEGVEPLDSASNPAQRARSTASIVSSMNLVRSSAATKPVSLPRERSHVVRSAQVASARRAHRISGDPSEQAPSHARGNSEPAPIKLGVICSSAESNVTTTNRT